VPWKELQTATCICAPGSGIICTWYLSAVWVYWMCCNSSGN